METNTIVHTADLRHLAFVKDLQKRHSNAVGFLPGIALAWYLENEHVKLARENGEPVGYVLGRNRLRYAPWCRPITQAAIAFDSQRRHHGASLIFEVCHEARLAGQQAVQCWCAADLEANAFWEMLAFERICSRDPSNARKRDLILWRKRITPETPVNFYTPPPVAGWKAAQVLLTKP